GLRQVASGVQGSDLSAWDGELALSWDGLCPVPEGSLPQGKLLDDLVEKLKALQATGEPRAWPLYVPSEGESPSTPGHSGSRSAFSGPSVLLRGFVAARIADVQVSEGDDPCLIVVLQPTILVTGTAMT